MRATFEKASHHTAFRHCRLHLDHPLSTLTTDSHPKRGFRPKRHVVREPALTVPPRLYPASGLDALPQCPVRPVYPQLSVCLPS